MIAIILVGALLALWLATALYSRLRLGINMHQALLYVPFKALFRIDDRAVRQVHAVEFPVIYAVWHQSRLEPALMLALLPHDTLHILDNASSRAWWLDPWRALGRTIAFNTHHVFVSRRLVRRLKGNGRLAVYLPDDASPDPKSFRLFRAIARIAAKAGARVVPIHVDGARHTAFSLAPPDVERRVLPNLRVSTLAPMTITEMVDHSSLEKPMAANAFFARMLQARGEPAPIAENRTAA
ncbi:2-acyl-glycerophospho-ethanolamine acyltransferase [Chelativorans sp. YIM 93263]|uniref:2-acyl-glycerophospho-ethanolamine acyltransferase n=1 Tax=Chelativorans sp. YIM 93263 TaxID=2906648 RepID=UPI0023788B4C|nr:2-acyl-glycerophospho-ethanolamine acyltransferase [Chelativorans sp. YIM 93263]